MAHALRLSLEDARRIVTDFVARYNDARLHSAIGYVTPKDKLLGNDEAIFAERDRKLAEARERRKQMRQTRHEKNEARADTSRPAIDFAAVRAAITIAQVLALLGFTPRSDYAGQQRGACPLHGSTAGTARCFSVNTTPTPSTASNAIVRETPWNCGPPPSVCRPTTPPSTYASGSTSRCPRWRHHQPRTEKRKP